MATQTLIQLKYSNITATPTSLDVAEPAYSFVSNTLFIGDGTNVLPIGGRYYTSLLDANTFYATGGTLVTRDPNGNSNFIRVNTDDVYANNLVYAGYAAATPLAGATNPIIGAGANANSYAQIYIRNINSGGSASADLIAYNDTGSDVSGWIDLGITSNTYNDSNYSVTGPSEGYLFMSAKNTGTPQQTGNLIIATDSTGIYNDIIFQTGGFTGAKHFIGRWRNGQGLVIDATTASSSNITGSLVSAGGAGFKGNVYADALYDLDSRVVTTITPVSGGGATFTQSKSGNTVTLTVNNTGVHSLTANSGDTTVSSTTGNITFGLATTSVSPGTYGGSSQVPTITVDSKGRVTFAGNSTISTSWSLAANTGTTDTINGGETLTIIGNGSGVTTTVANNQLVISTDNTVMRTNTATTGTQSIGGDVSISGNLIVNGTTTYVNTSIVQTSDSLIVLASNNTTGDVVDIGFVGKFNNGSQTQATGLVRDAGNKAYYLFSGVDADSISNANTIANNLFTTSNTATLYANINAPLIVVTNGDASTSTTTGAVKVTGGIGASGNVYAGGIVSGVNFVGGVTVTTAAAGTTVLGALSNHHQRLTGSTTQTFQLPNATTLQNGHTFLFDNDSSGSLTITNSTTATVDVVSSGGIDHIYLMDNSTAAGTWGKYAYLPASVNWGSTSADLGGTTVSNATWQGSTIAIAYGGTNNTTFTSGQRIVYDGDKLASQSNTSTTVTGGLSTANTISSLTLNSYGEITAYTGSAIAIGASQITSGTISVTQGGTGSSSFNVKGVVVSDSSSTTGALTALTGSAYQVLQLNASGVPVFGGLNGGTF